MSSVHGGAGGQNNVTTNMVFTRSLMRYALAAYAIAAEPFGVVELGVRRGNDIVGGCKGRFPFCYAERDRNMNFC